MNDFDTTLCILAERTKDGVTYECRDPATQDDTSAPMTSHPAPSTPRAVQVSLQGTLLQLDCATRCVRGTHAACAPLVAAIARAVCGAGPDSRLLCLLAWPAAHSRLDRTDECGVSLSDRVMREVVRRVARDLPRQAVHRRWQDDPVRTLPSDAVSGVTDLTTSLPFDRCMAFAHDDTSSLICAELGITDAAMLHTLRDLTLVEWCSTRRNTVVTLLVSVLFSTTSLAALQVATSRHVFVCVDDTVTAAEVRSTVTEWGVVRRWVTERMPPPQAPTTHTAVATAATTLARSVATPTQAAPVRRHDIVSSTEDARGAEDDEEDLVDADALSSSSCRPVVSALAPERGLTRSLRVTQQQAHTQELRVLRLELDRLRAEKASAVAERAAYEQLLHGASPTPTVAPPVMPELGDLVHSDMNVELVRLRDELRAALKSKRFLEEKTRLLEFRDALSRTMTTTSLGQPRGVAVDVAQLQDELNQMRTACAREVAVWRERAAASQQALLAVTRELTTLRAESVEVNKTLELQARVIAEAKRAMLARRAVQDGF